MFITCAYRNINIYCIKTPKICIFYCNKDGFTQAVENTLTVNLCKDFIHKYTFTCTTIEKSNFIYMDIEEVGGGGEA